MPSYTARWRIVAAALWLAAWGLGTGAETGATEKTEMPARDIQNVLSAHKPRLLAMDGVVGVGRGLCAGAPCIKVMILQKTPELVEAIGSEADGYVIEIIETGEIRALEKN